MKPVRSSRLYDVVLALCLVGASVGIAWLFWSVTADDVRRSNAEMQRIRDAVLEAAKPARPATDTLPSLPEAVPGLPAAPTEWRRSAAEALADTLYLLRLEGRLPEALEVLERWLATRPGDGARRLAAGRLAFEVGSPQRGVGHYRLYFSDRTDDNARTELVERVLRELDAAAAATALATLLDVDGPLYPVRIALARVAAQQGDARGADRLLDPVPAHSDPAVDSLRLLLRGAYDPDVPTAARAVAEYPEEPQYRLAYARALRRADRPAEALAPYRRVLETDTSLALREEVADGAILSDSLAWASTLLASILAQAPDRDGTRLTLARVLARAGDAAGALREFTVLIATRPTAALLEEANGTLSSVDDVALTVPFRQRVLQWHPDDASTRFRLALDLEALRDFTAAEAQADTLLATAPPEVPLYLMRARLRAARNDLPGAIADLRAADALDPTVDVALLEGDIRRWTGLRSELTAARDAYERAARRAPPGDPRIAERRRLLAAARRQMLGWEPEYGAQIASMSLQANDGFASHLVRHQSGLAPFPGLSILTIGGEVRRLEGEGTAARLGVAGDVGFSGYLAGLAWRARAGASAFEGAPASFTGLIEATYPGTVHRIRATVSRQPAYPLLRSAETVGSIGVLNGTTVALATNGSVGDSAVEYYASVEAHMLGDGNRVQVGVLSVRVPIHGPWGMVLSSSASTFRDPAETYWSPELFTLQGLGLEYRHTVPRGLSLVVRVQPTYASVRHPGSGRPVGTERSLQSTATADLLWRHPRWEIAAFSGYGQDRGGSYAAGFAGLRARVPW